MAQQKITISNIYNANVYLDGVNYLGRAAEVELPKLKAKMEEHAGLGLQFGLELPAGFEKMEGKIKWEGHYDEVAMLSANPYQSVAMQLRASRQSYSSQGKQGEQSVVVYLNVRFKESDQGKYKARSKAEYDTAFSVDYFKLVVDGKELIEVDVFANIYKIAGKDQLAEYRDIIGS